MKAGRCHHRRRSRPDRPGGGAEMAAPPCSRCPARRRSCSATATLELTRLRGGLGAAAAAARSTLRLAADPRRRRLPRRHDSCPSRGPPARQGPLRWPQPAARLSPCAATRVPKSPGPTCALGPGTQSWAGGREVGWGADLLARTALQLPGGAPGSQLFVPSVLERRQRCPRPACRLVRRPSLPVLRRWRGPLGVARVVVVPRHPGRQKARPVAYSRSEQCVSQAAAQS